MTTVRLESDRLYLLAEVAPKLGLKLMALQARLRRAEERTEARVIEVTSWISAFRLCNGREWRSAHASPPHRTTTKATS